MTFPSSVSSHNKGANPQSGWLKGLKIKDHVCDNMYKLKARDVSENDLDWQLKKTRLIHNQNSKLKSGEKNCARNKINNIKPEHHHHEGLLSDYLKSEDKSTFTHTTEPNWVLPNHNHLRKLVATVKATSQVIYSHPLA